MNSACRPRSSSRFLIECHTAGSTSERACPARQTATLGERPRPAVLAAPADPADPGSGSGSGAKSGVSSCCSTRSHGTSSKETLEMEGCPNARHPRSHGCSTSPRADHLEDQLGPSPPCSLSASRPRQHSFASSLHARQPSVRAQLLAHSAPPRTVLHVLCCSILTSTSVASATVGSATPMGASHGTRCGSESNVSAGIKVAPYRSAYTGLSAAAVPPCDHTTHHTLRKPQAKTTRCALFSYSPVGTCSEDDRRDGEDLDRALAGDVRADQHANRAEHRKAAVVQLLELIVLPRLSRLPLRRAEEVSGLVVCPPCVQDANHLDERDENQDLNDAQLRRLPQQRVAQVSTSWRSLPSNFRTQGMVGLWRDRG